MRLQLVTALTISAVLGACGPSASGPVPTNNVYTDVQGDGTTITGRYDPATFSTAQVRTMVSAGVCTQPGLTGYAEEAVDGQVRFSFTCTRGSKYGAYSGINFFRAGANAVTYAATFSENGVIQQTKGTINL